MDETKSNLANDKREFLKKLYEQCLKSHKAKMKRLKESNVDISQSHIDFIKSCINYAPKLAENKDVKINRVKICQSLLDILLIIESSHEQESAGHEKRNVVNLKTLNRDIAYSIGHLTTDEFQQIIETICVKLFQNTSYEERE